MRFHVHVLVAVALLAVVAACGDDGPGLPTGGQHWLVDFERVTLSSDTPDRIEIEIVVRTGSNLSQPAPDGTILVVTATAGHFAGDHTQIRVPTSDGHALVTLMLTTERPVRSTVTARVGTAQATISILVDETGSMRLGV